MPDKLAAYRSGTGVIHGQQQLWPLYGVGFENFGRDDQPITADVPGYGPDELLIRHDAVGLCFSDIKIIRMGEDHPRIYRRMADNPVVQGHEVALTVVGVGENLQGQYTVGDRFTIQADIFVDGVGYAYGYEIQGGLSQYNVIDSRILAGDDGNYLLPILPTTGYAEAALTEPWACVIATYGLTYRTGLKAGGTTWIIGTHGTERPYIISAGFDEDSHPARLFLTEVSGDFEADLWQRADKLGVPVTEVPDLSDPPLAEIDDIVVLGADPETIETVSQFLALHGILAVVSEEPLPRPVSIDVGRVHYNRWLYVGTTETDIARAYQDVPVRAELKPGGIAWVVGAGGPMGRMHVQRALQIDNGPQTVVCTDISDTRLDDLRESFAPLAAEQEVNLVCLNSADSDAYDRGIAPYLDSGFDDIVVMAPVPTVIANTAQHLAPHGVMNVFAGLKRGTHVDLDLNDTLFKDTRIIGHSASSIDDLKLMLQQVEAGRLSPNQSVAAVGSLTAAKEGLLAVRDAVYPGKIVIYPQIRDFPLTALPYLKKVLPTVYALLRNGREWTKEAEEEFLRLMLPESQSIGDMND